ncbi:hypothetical protein RHSIM_Rhsim13G0204600 [Rhododendron simsii]|uniref:Uncharacterized protein n=1 Tax=Rhododendron simsii TaxID=118357 RepID=A0A834G0L2_RHOSS|nr:hypothetical protein RHSIM_Rhsim13G0204600 [Rhododendron simsii]
MFKRRTMPEKCGATIPNSISNPTLSCIPNSISNPTLSSISKSDQSFLRVHEESGGKDLELKRTEIERYPGKCLTHKILKKKPNKGSKNAKLIMKTGSYDSFFNFSNPPEVLRDDDIDEYSGIVHRKFKHVIFDEMFRRVRIWNVVSWNAMIANFAQRSLEHAAVGLVWTNASSWTNKPSSFHPPKIIQQYKSFAVAITRTLQTSNTRKVTSVEIIAGISHIKKHITTNWKHVPIHHLGVIAQS